MMYNRVVQEKRAHKLLKPLVTSETTIGEISGKMAKQMRLRPKSFERFDFPEYDVCGDPFVDESGEIRQFDVMIANQVWEHLDRPYRATQNIHAMLNDGGYFYVAVPFYVRYHGYPVDCSRWSARGLKNLLIEGGFEEEKINAEQWGNVECAKAECGYRFARYDEEKHSLKNDPQFPVVAWAVAQK